VPPHRQRTDSSDTTASNGSLGGSITRQKRNKISLVSDQDLATMKLEEAKKLESLSKDELRSSVIVNDDNFDVDDFGGAGDATTTASSAATTLESVSENNERFEPPQPSVRTRLHVDNNGGSGAGNNNSNDIDAAKAPQQMTVEDIDMLANDVTKASDECLDVDNNISNTPAKSTPELEADAAAVVVPDETLSPAERRAVEAEKRKQYRLARCKELDADTLQAQIVMTKEKRMQGKLNGNEAST